MSYHGFRYVSRSLGFAMGYLYWYSLGILVPYEIVAASLVIDYWPNSVPLAAWITIMLVVIVVLNYMPVGVYGETEFWFAGITALFFGNWNLLDGMFVVAAITPIGAGLHEPVLICWPLVMGRLGTVAQKLMKLFGDVSEGTWPAVGWSWPSFSKPVAITDWRSVSDCWGSLLLPPAAAVPEACVRRCDMSDPADKARCRKYSQPQRSRWRWQQRRKKTQHCQTQRC